ncbi:MAG: PASTA domain-containing protein [Bacteroidota bacterium]
MKAFANKAWSKLKYWSIETYRFLISPIFLKNFLGITTLLAVLIFFSFWWMHCYTKHGESLQVHDYTGMDLNEAIAMAEKKSFSIVVNDSIYLPEKVPNTVLNQNPKALSRVKENRKVYLTITKSNPDMITIPDLLGGNDDYRNYRRKLERLRVRSKIVGRKFSSKLEPNTILEVIYKGDTITESLDMGYKVAMGTTVEFIVTEKSGGTVPVPNLICRQYDAAQFLIGNYNLNVGSLIEDATVKDQYTAHIWKQVPPYRPGAKMRVGSQIDLYLTQYKPDDCAGARPNEANIEQGKDLAPQRPHLKKPVEQNEEENEEF